jgi:hypothetical protein
LKHLDQRWICRNPRITLVFLMKPLAAELEDLGGADITGALEELPLRSFVADGEGVVRWQNAASRSAIGV